MVRHLRRAAAAALRPGGGGGGERPLRAQRLQADDDLEPPAVHPFARRRLSQLCRWVVDANIPQPALERLLADIARDSCDLKVLEVECGMIPFDPLATLDEAVVGAVTAKPAGSFRS